MKPSTPETGKADRKFVQRLQALIRPGRKKLHRLSASVTGEEDWDVDEPQIRMSRAFAVMLVLHLVAVGGLFAFHVFGKDDREAEQNATRTAHLNSLPPPAAPAQSTAPVPPAAPAGPAPAPRAEIVADDPPASDSPQSHILKAGESKMLLTAKYGVTEQELEQANPGMEFKTGEILTIPRHQRVIGAIASNPEPANPPLALIVATPSEEVGHRDFALKKGAEDPYAPVEPAELAAMAQETSAAARTKTVKAEPTPPVVRAGSESVASEEPEARPAPAPKVKKATPPAVAATPAKPKPAATGSRTHVVGKGDTVYNVAKRYGLSPGEVLRANGISDPSRLQMGQVLKITVRR
jgi:LysM repeat protein